MTNLRQVPDIKETWEKPVCVECASEDVTQEATVSWDIEKQEWEVVDVLDNGWTCGSCSLVTHEDKWVDA